jgi:hypothetical protein
VDVFIDFIVLGCGGKWRKQGAGSRKQTAGSRKQKAGSRKQGTETTWLHDSFPPSLTTAVVVAVP